MSALWPMLVPTIPAMLEVATCVAMLLQQ